MKIGRVMIAAPKSGSGKTILTCGLLLALLKAGRQVVSVKCGPDYIDPMFHEKALGIPGKNLDTFFTGEEQTRALFLRDVKEGDLAVFEGVMGLFDGLSGIRPEGSSYHLAQVTQTPILLAVDAKGMGRSLVPLVAGFLAYDKAHLIKGVLLNRISPAYAERLSPLIEELGVPVVGCFPEQPGACLESRHLGLVLPGELQGLRKRLEAVAGQFQESVSLEKILKIMEEAAPLSPVPFPPVSQKRGERPVIAVARDAAFCFYYRDNLHLLEEMGARLSYFSPLSDKALPEDADAVLLGGGYPELYGETLGNNREMLAAIRCAAEKKMPMVAECGGFLYLHQAIEDREGRRFPMAGVLPGVCRDTGKLVRFGYVELEEKAPSFLPPGQRIKGHEFHYYDSPENGDGCTARKPGTGKSCPCVVADENRFLGFPHLYYPSNPSFARLFVEKAMRFGLRKKG